MVEASKTFNVDLCITRNQLYDPTIQRGLDLIADIGKVTAVYCFVGGGFKPNEKPKWADKLLGGEMGEHLPHRIYLVRRFMGVEPTSIRAKFKNDILDVCMEGGDVNGFINPPPTHHTKIHPSSCPV